MTVSVLNFLISGVWLFTALLNLRKLRAEPKDARKVRITVLMNLLISSFYLWLGLARIWRHSH